MKIIVFLFRLSPGVVSITALAGLITGLSNTGLLILISAALSKTGGAQEGLVWKFIALGLVMLGSRITSEVLLTHLAQGANFELRMRLCRQVLSVPLRRLEEIGAHRILATLTDDVSTIGATIAALPLLIMHMAIVLGILCYLGWLSRWALLWVLVFIAIAVVSYQFPLASAARYIRQIQGERDKLYKHFRMLTDGSKELKLHRRRREVFLSEVVQTTARALARFTTSANTIIIVIASWGHLLIFVLIGLLLFALPGRGYMDQPILTSYTLAILYLMTPMEVLLNRLPTIRHASVSLQRVEELGILLASSSGEDLPVEDAGADASWKPIELVGVSHTYHVEQEKSNFTLGPIDLTFRPGEIVFLVGGNGSGKTTLAKLMTGLYIPEQGHIQFNGEPVTDENRGAYREQFSAVFSDFCLFESLLGLEAPDIDDKALGYLKRLQLEHKVKVNSGVLSTTALSQGQRKRLALLTAYLEDRPFYVFDEWAADQDPTFKNVFYNHLLPELKGRGKTVIVISHDDRFYYKADRIFKLENGKLEFAEDGLHANVLAASLPEKSRADSH
ncbi:MAG TPA: cyclic peptide export ABC transporter [Blastocatellia bacterium]|jgi:putative ATP-binding cassette transporter|nr:cyclic peptide export ABC transporter [Blastocatellia bacterium]